MKKGLGHRRRISNISNSSALLAFLLFFCAILPAEADVIQAGRDVQSAIDSAQPGDMVLVMAGEANSFVVDRPLTIEGQGNPSVSAALQKPAIKVLSAGAFKQIVLADKAYVGARGEGEVLLVQAEDTR